MAWTVLLVGLFDLQLSYILAFIGKVEIAQDLSIAVCTTIIGVYAPYLVKAFFGKKAEVENENKEREVICLEPIENDPLEDEEGWEDLTL